MKRKKFCPVCGELVAVYQGDPDKYGDRAIWNYYQFIRLKYDCDECRDMMKNQSVRLAVKRFRTRERERRAAFVDVVEAYREETRLSNERAGLLERENRTLRQRLSEQGAERR